MLKNEIGGLTKLGILIIFFAGVLAGVIMDWYGLLLIIPFTIGCCLIILGRK